MTLRQKIAAYRENEFKLVDAVQDFLEAIERDKVLNAYLYLSRDEAFRAAQNMDMLRASGSKLPPLAGIVLAVKDNIHIKNQPTTCASRILQSFIAPFSATVIDRLERAGALFIGKTNMDEFAMGSSGAFSAYGPTQNPCNPTKTPGGSSSGSAAAVAARLADAALGSDTGGSVRQPAAFTELVGLKPSYGRVSRYGLVAFASSLDQIGILSHSVEDSAVLLHEMAGYDLRDATCSAVKVPDYVPEMQKSVKNLRIGFVHDHRYANRYFV